MKKIILTIMISLLLCSSSFAVVIIEDGEGTSAQLDARYTYSGDNAIRVAQLTTENPGISVPVGSGAAKFVFDVEPNGPWRSAYKHTYSSSQDWSAYRQEGMSLQFYWNGWDDNRSLGKTQTKLYFDMSDDAGKSNGWQITLYEGDGSSESELGHLVEGWNSLYINLPDWSDWSSFRVDGSTINGNAIDSGNFTTVIRGLSGPSDYAALFANVKSFNIQDNHGGYGSGSVEGFYAIDDMKMVPEPISLGLILLGLPMLLRRRK